MSILYQIFKLMMLELFVLFLMCTQPILAAEGSGSG